MIELLFDAIPTFKRYANDVMLYKGIRYGASFPKVIHQAFFNFSIISYFSKKKTEISVSKFYIFVLLGLSVFLFSIVELEILESIPLFVVLMHKLPSISTKRLASCRQLSTGSLRFSWKWTPHPADPFSNVVIDPER